MDAPTELRERQQWVNWKNLNGTKIPFQPGGEPAKSNDPETWYFWDDVTTGSASPAWMFSADDPYCGVDLDDCYDGEEFLPWALEIIERFEGIAWIEISPSGTGVKLITRAKKPIESRCAFNQDGVKVECYDNRRFWAWTGKVLHDGQDIRDGQDAIDWLIAKYLTGAKRETGKVRELANTADAPEWFTKVTDAYVTAAKLPVEGSARNSAFSLSGHLHAFVGDEGSRLSDRQVFDYLIDWNSRGGNVMRGIELSEATVNGRTNGMMPADKLIEKVRLADETGTDLSGILASAPEIESPPKLEMPKDPGPFPWDAVPHGDCIISRVIAANLESAKMAQPEMAFAGAICLMSALTGRKIIGPSGMPPNIFVIVLGDTSSGKNHARDVNKALLELSGGADLRGAERFVSSAGIMTAVTEKLSQLFQVDEVGELIGAITNERSGSHIRSIMQVLMQLYTDAGGYFNGSAFGDSKKNQTIHCPHAVLFGTTTPEGLWNNLNTKAIDNGFLNRIMIIEGRKPPLLDITTPSFRDIVSDELIADVKAWADFTGKGIDWSIAVPERAKWTDNARDRLAEHAMLISKKRADDKFGAGPIWSRCNDKALKLALLFACARYSSDFANIEITLEDADRAIRISNWLVRRTVFMVSGNVADSESEKNIQKVLRVITAAKGGLTQRSFYLKTRTMTRRDRDEATSHLIQEGEIFCELSPSANGKNLTTWKRRLS